MFFPSRKYLIDLIKSNQEILERIVSDERLFLNSAKKEEYLRKKESLIREIDQAKQDLRLRDEAGDAGKVKEPLFGKPSIRFPFNDWSTERLAKGQKIATSRTSQFGNVGDTFTAGDRTFEVTSVSRKSLGDVAQNYYFDEGATSPEEFKQVWESIHPGGFKPGQIVYFHQFRELTPEVVQLKDLLAKAQLTQEESRKAVSLTQKIYKTESRNVLTPEQNLALNRQVRQNLADSYAQLLKERHEGAANAAAYRKRQLEEEYNTLLQIKKRAPVPDVPEIPPLSPITDKGFMKNVENFPFVTYEPRPPINYVIKPREADISDFAPQWFGKQDTPDTLPPIVPPTSVELAADWFQFRHYILREAMEERKGIVSLPRYQGTDRTVGVPEIKSPLFVERTPQEIASVKKAERREEEAGLIKEVKEKRLFINKGKPGGRLTDDDFYEPGIGDDGRVFYRLAFFRTKEGTIQYAGENTNIMPESQLSQDLNPSTSVEELSFISSERLGKMMKERGAAYRFEQYDRDAILSNKGLPVKKLDDLKRDEERFKKEFVSHFFIKHPEQLQTWLDKADPDTLRYLNEVWGGIDVVKRQYLPQIEYVARNEKGERVRKSLVVAKTNYDLPEDLAFDRALKEQLIQKGLIETAENRMLSVLSQKSSAGELLARELDENIPLDVDVSARKIVQAVQAETASAKKNTVVYLIEEEVPTEPERYSQLVKDLQEGKKQYLSKIGEEIKGEEVKLHEPGLGMSVSSDVLDLLKPQDVPKGIRTSDLKPVENDIQVVRLIPPFKKMAPFKTIKDVRAQALKEIESDDAALKGADSLAIKGTVIYAVKEPWGNIRQKGTLVTESGELYDFVEYKGPSASNPILEYHKRYTIPKPQLRFPEGAQRLTIPLNENKAVYSPYENYQVSTRGRVTEAHFGDEGSKTSQWGYIEDEEGSKIKWTTFKEDKTPELKAGQDYTIYNAWMQAYQEKPRWDPVKREYIVSPTTGKPEININIKPQNIYSRDALAKEEDAERIKELRESTYRTVAEIGQPKLFEQSAGLQPKPRQVLPPVDPVIATTVENGEIIVITKSGKRIPSEEYRKQFKPVAPRKDVGVAHDEETLNKIEEENPFDDETLFMMGLLPLGAFAVDKEDALLPGDRIRKKAKDAWTEARAGLTPEQLKEQQQIAIRAAAERNAAEFTGVFTGAYSTLSELGGIWYKKLSEADERIRARDAAAPETEFGNFGLALENAKYQLAQLPWNALDVAGGVLYPLAYPSQAVWGMKAGLSPMEGIRQETRPAEVLGIENPWEAFAADILGDPLNLLAGAGLVRKVAKGEEVLSGARQWMNNVPSGARNVWQDIQKGMPDFLRNEEAVLGRRALSESESYNKAVESTIKSVEKLKSTDIADETALDTALNEYKVKREAFRQVSHDVPEEVKLEQASRLFEYHKSISSLPEGLSAKLQEPQYAEVNQLIWEDLYDTATLQKALRDKAAVKIVSKPEPEVVETSLSQAVIPQPEPVFIPAPQVPAVQPVSQPVPGNGFQTGLDLLKESGLESSGWDQWTKLFEPQDIRRYPAAHPTKITGFDRAAAEAYKRSPEVQAKLSRGEIIAPETLYDVASKGMLNVIDQKVVEETLKTFPDLRIPRVTTREEAIRFRIEQARAAGEKVTPEMEDYIRQSEEKNPSWQPKPPKQQKVFPIAEPPKVPIEVPPMTEAEEQAWKEWQDITNKEVPPPRKSIPKSDYEIDPTTREQVGVTPPSSPSGEIPASEGATRKSILRKLFQIENEIAKKEAEKPPFDWKKAGVYALAGVTGTTAAAIGLAGMLNAQQEEEIRRYEADLPPQPVATEIPPSLANISITPEALPEAGESSAASQIGDTAMAAAGTALGIAQEAHDVVMSSPLGPVVGEGWDIFMKAMDILQTASYAEGGLIKSAQSVLANPADTTKWKFYGYQWKITPSEALGVVEKGELSWRTVPALALDIAIDPMTYLTLGSGAATKIGIVGSKQIALNPKGVRALAEVAKKVGPKQGEREFAEMLALDPRLRKEYQAFEGIGLRGWGPLFSGHEKELVSREALETIKAAPKGYWDRSLRAMATSGNPQVEHAAEVLLRADESAGRKVDWVKDVVGRKFTPFYEIKKIQRPSSLGPRDPEYAERFMQFKHTVRFRTSQLYKRMEKLRDEAKDELGSGYKDIVARYMENPVLRESAGLSPKTVKIIEELETYNKAFAEAEAERGLLENTMEGYLHHMLSPEAKKYLEEKGMTYTEVFAPLRSKLESARMRGYRGSIEEVNELARSRLGFNLFDPDPFKATAVRGAESFHATGEYDLLEYVTKNYGGKVTEITDPSMGFAWRTPHLMNLLPPEVSITLLKDAKDILKKVEPTREYTSWTGQKFTASDVLHIAAENKLVREKIADQAAREVVETEFGKKAVAIHPDQEEIARTAVLLDRLTRGVPEKEAAEYALANLRNVELPKAILEHLEPAIADKKWYEPVIKGYDKGMNVWKYFQTVPFPAYHAGNIFGWGWNSMMLGETNPASAIEAMKVAFYKLPEGSLRKKAFKPLFETRPEDRFITTALGETYSYDDLFEAAGEYGAFGQPGAMDITGKMEFSERTDLWGKTVKGASRIDPANMARSEENVMRLAVFIDRVKAGDTFIDAARYSAKFNFDYMPEAKTVFMNTYMARAFPFLTWQYNNILLQSEMFFKMPGKYSTFGKTAEAAMGNEEPPDWAKEGYLPRLTEEGKFAYMRTPITDLTFFNNPAMYGAQALAPFIKAPMEAGAAQSFFTGREFKDPVTEAALENFPGRPYSTYKMLSSPNKTPEEKAWKGLLTVGTARTQTELTLEERFKKASRRKEDFTWQQRFEGWKRDEMASPLSGISDELQGGHMQAVAEGGKAEMSNFLTMTFEENLEQTSSQVFRMGLPEKKFLQDKFWEEMNVKEGTKLQESTLRTTEKLEKEGKWVNNAVREKLEYDAKKAINIQLYSRELAKIRMQLDWAERRLRNEQRGMEQKRKDPDFKEDKWSERQIQALEWFIPKYQAQYAAIERLREQERAKEFELPEQIIQGENYDKGMLGKEREVNIRGKGPALADPEQIKNMVKYDEIALERSVVLEDVAILNLPKYIPKHIRDSIKKPTGPEWKEKQDKAAWYARAIWGDEPEVPEEPAAVGKQEDGWVVSPLMPVASVALINMGMGRTSPVPGLNKPLKKPASPLEMPAGSEAPNWNLRLPSVSDVVGLFLPHPDAAEPASEEAVQQKADMAKEDFLESDEFITAVQSIITDYLDRGVER